MKYFLDTEFIEGTQKKFFGETKPTIDLISIGLVDENGREYYAISKDFNLKEAWNRFDLLEANTSKNHSMNDIKVYWIRENILRPIYKELHLKENLQSHQALFRANIYIEEKKYNFTFKEIKRLINKYGETKVDIANGICAFIYGDDCGGSGMSAIEMATRYEISDKALEPEFYAYYSAYDWVAFCWIFGKMIQLPKGFPMYCNDLKQMMDEKLKKTYLPARGFDPNCNSSLESKLKEIKRYKEYPKQENEHNALDDAKWNLELYKFLLSIHKW